MPSGARSLAIDAGGRTLYVIGADTATIQTYAMGANGLPVATGAALPTGPSPVAVTIDPTGRTALVLNRGTDSSTILLYAIGANGALIPVAGSPFDTGITGATAFTTLAR